jgi:hypothetical protein
MMKDVLLILPKDDNDLAALTALLPEGAAIEPVEGDPGTWLSPAQTEPWFKNDQLRRVLIADLRCREVVAGLHRQGISVTTLGNRLYSGDSRLGAYRRVPGRTALEQLATLFCKPLPEAVAWREAWRRDGWAGLSALGVPWNYVTGNLLRRYSDRWEEAREIAEQPVHELDDLRRLLAPAALADVAMDALQQPDPPVDRSLPNYSRGAEDEDERDYECMRSRHRPVAVKPGLVLYHPPDRPGLEHVRRIEYAGSRARLAWLASLLNEPDLCQDFDLTLEIGSYRVRLIAQARASTDTPAVNALISRLLSVVLVTGRPLRRYTCTFLLPLDLHLKEELGRADGFAATTLRDALDKRVKRKTLECVRFTLEEAVDRIKAIIAKSESDPAERARLRQGKLTEEAKEAQALLYILAAYSARPVRGPEWRVRPR